MASSVNKWRYWPEPDQPLPEPGAARQRERRQASRALRERDQQRLRQSGVRRTGRARLIFCTDLTQTGGGRGSQTRACSTGGTAALGESRLELAGACRSGPGPLTPDSAWRDLSIADTCTYIHTHVYVHIGKINRREGMGEGNSVMKNNR